MKAIVKERPEPGLQLQQVPVPRPGPQEVLVQVLSVGICGTDGHIYRWDRWAQSRIRPPLVIGHEFCGNVVEVGGEVTSVRVGERVTAEMHFNCGLCYHCRTGQAHICDHIRIGGVDTDGCFAEYVVVPERNVWKVDPAIPTEVASIMDPLGNAVHTALTYDLTGRTVAITGCGPIGLFAVAIAQKAGATAVFATDVSPYRLALAAKMGADDAIDARTSDPVAVVRSRTGGLGVDVLLEMSGNPNAVRQGLAMLRKGGSAALLGLLPGAIELDLNDAVIFKEATLRGVNGRKMFETWYQMQGLLLGGLDVTPVITHRFPFEAYQEAFELLSRGDCGKVILQP